MEDGSLSRERARVIETALQPASVCGRPGG